MIIKNYFHVLLKKKNYANFEILSQPWDLDVILWGWELDGYNDLLPFIDFLK